MKHFFQKLLFAVIAFGFTAFVFLNTYEVVFNRDVAFAQSIQPFGTQQVLDTVAKDFDIPITSENSETLPALEGIDRIEVPALKIQVKLEEARRIDGQWYQRPSALHYAGLNKNQFGITVDYLLYTTKSWRTVPAPERLEPGMTVELYYGSGAVSSFEIAEKKVQTYDKSLLVSKSEDRQLLLVVDDTSNHAYFGYSLVLRK